MANIEWQNNIKSYFPAKERVFEKKNVNVLSIKPQLESKNDKKVFSEQILDEVYVKAKRDENGEFNEYGNPYWKIYGKADGVIKVDKNSGGRSFMDIIRGRIPGLQIIEDDGKITYRFRGIGTLMSGDGNVPPLFLLDGVVYDAPRDDSSPLMHIPIREIDKIEYLVNESTSLFGTRAAGGVIAIFTKRGATFYENANTLSSVKLKGFEKFTDSKTQETGTELWNPSFQILPHQAYEFKMPKRRNTKRLLLIQGITYEGQSVVLYEVLP